MCSNVLCVKINVIALIYQHYNLTSFRYGGWYTDLDTVTVRPTNHIENTVAISGDFVANGNLVFSRNYTFLWKLMIKANARYTGLGWNSLGPVLLTDTIRKLQYFMETINDLLPY